MLRKYFQEKRSEERRKEGKVVGMLSKDVASAENQCQPGWPYVPLWQLGFGWGFSWCWA